MLKSQGNLTGWEKGNDGSAGRFVLGEGLENHYPPGSDPKSLRPAPDPKTPARVPHGILTPPIPVKIISPPPTHLPVLPLGCYRSHLDPWPGRGPANLSWVLSLSPTPFLSNPPPTCVISATSPHCPSPLFRYVYGPHRPFPGPLLDPLMAPPPVGDAPPCTPQPIACRTPQRRPAAGPRPQPQAPP